jgi:HD-GYP domain-containing protein (c-di-GMP phosphodiesterase class II)
MTDKVKNQGGELQIGNFLGEVFLRAFYRLIQTVKIHQDNNHMLFECAKDLVDCMAPWWVDEDYLTIKVSRGRFLLEDEKLLYRRQNANLIQEMLCYFEKRNLQGLRFHRPVKDCSFEEILSFVRFLNLAERQSEPVKWLAQQLDDMSFLWVEIVQDPQGDSEKRDLERREMARRTYSYALSSLKEVSEKIVSERRAGTRKLKRITQNMVDLLTEDESVLLGMSTVRDYDDYTYTHSVNVAILSLCLGKRIGLSRVSVTRLGMCGLVHDLGKVEVPQEILNKPGKLTDQEFKEMKRHPIQSVSQIIKLRASRDLKAKIVLPPFEHHLKYDLSGYPQVKSKKRVSLFGRILTITDVFDALTSPRIYRPRAFSPDHALGMMLEGSGKDFDPILLKAFINMLGVYPIGTFLYLDTGEMGLVKESPENGDKARPKVVLLKGNRQGGFKKDKVVNLAEKDTRTGLFKRNPKRSINPSVLGIQAAEFLV